MKRDALTVTQVNSYIKRMIASDLHLQSICIKGEISNCKYHSTGHIYFTLKDAGGAIPAVMFKANRVRGLAFPMKDGDQVLVSGSISVYERDGKYQLYANHITLDGAGDLYVRYEQLKKELQEMGMFDDAYKKPIPRYATKIGVITAPTGAAVRDIIQVSRRRNPHVSILLYPALVQGDGAAESIVNGLMTLDSMGLDVIIVGRGGGSIEDLWAFNEEVVARAVFSCATPIISAVGHETDTTICDYVADLRAPTPSAAAEQAVFSYADAKANLLSQQIRLQQAMQKNLQKNRQKLSGYEERLKLLSPMGRLRENRQRLMHLEERMQQDMDRILEKRRNQICLFAERLDGMSPLKKLSQGYSYTSDIDGKGIKSTKDLAVGDLLQVYLVDGKIKTRVDEIDEDITWQKKN